MGHILRAPPLELISAVDQNFGPLLRLYLGCNRCSYTALAASMLSFIEQSGVDIKMPIAVKQEHPGQRCTMNPSVLSALPSVT